MSEFKVNRKSDCEKIKIALSSDDLIIREFSAGGVGCALFFYDGLSDKQLLEQDVIRPILVKNEEISSLAFLQNTLLYSDEIKTSTDFDEALKAIAKGEIVLLVDRAECFYFLSLKSYNHRAVQEPPTETVLKGPREGFIEDIKVNLTLIRRRLKTPLLRVRQLSCGRESATAVAVVYLDKIADNETVGEIVSRIEKIDIDGIVSANYIEKYVEHNKNSIFNQTGVTEKPDIVTAKLLEGRVAIVVDGSPTVLTVPYLLFESFQDSYDYYTRDHRATMLRAVRVIGAMFSVMLPGLYVAVQEYHYHLLPLKFLISVLNSISGLPFTPPMEMLFVLILFEVLHQASVRMPRYVGTALSIVGAIVLGETAVRAGLLSSPAVLIVAISAIGINCVPELVDSFSILRIAVLLTGSVLGLFGIVIFVVMTLAYLCGLENYKTPYLAPFAPFIASDMKDAVIKDSLLNMKNRPYSVSTTNRRRLGNE